MSSRSLNKVMLIGNLTRDPELRYTPNGTAVCTLGIATNRSWLSEGAVERKEETEFHRIVAWNKLAELCAQLLAKGRKVFVEGRLSTRSWTGQDGMQRTVTEIVIDDMIILDSRKNFEEAQAAKTVFRGSVPTTIPASPVVSTPAPQPAVSAPAPAVSETAVAPKPEETPTEEKPAKKKKTAKEEKEAPEPTAEEPAEADAPKDELNTDDIPF